jgi:hypothetical protein
MDARSAEITTLLKAWSGGDQAALEQLAEQVYPESRLIARRCMKNGRAGNTLHATALVHEVYLRLVDVTKIEWQERAQFFAMAARDEAARARGAKKAEACQGLTSRRPPFGRRAGRVSLGSRRGLDAVLAVRSC